MAEIKSAYVSARLAFCLLFLFIDVLFHILTGFRAHTMFLICRLIVLND